MSFSEIFLVVLAFVLGLLRVIITYMMFVKLLNIFSKTLMLKQLHNAF